MRRIVLVAVIIVLIGTGINAYSAVPSGGVRDEFVRVAQEVGPAVVSISVVQVYTIGGRNIRLPFRSGDPFLDEFLREFFGAPQQYKMMGLGSGVIIDKRGYILTNEHVVGNAARIEVTLPDGRKFTGTVKGTDPRSDLAVVKIDADNLPVARLGDSSKVKPGEWVMAIGNPFGFIMSNPQPTVTVGVVSAIHRSFAYRGIDQTRYYSDLIQTDAAINRGNSGGPLVNLDGEVIGINTLIFSTSGGYEGIGFAIPINHAKRVLDALITGREVKYGWLGVQVQSLTSELVELFGFPDERGALVADVVPGSPAEKAGIRKGDLIRKVGNRKIYNSTDLVGAITGRRVGEKVNIVVWRNGKLLTIPVIIGERPSERRTLLSGSGVTKRKWRGIEVSDLSASIKQQFGVEADKGVVVTKVIVDSPAFDAGIREGDVIDEINRVQIDNTDDFYEVTNQVEGDALVHTSRGYFVVRE